MKKIFLLGILICLTLVTNAQSKIERLTLRQSFQSKNELAEPAVISFSKAQGKSASWLLNAAIGYNFENLTKNSNNGIFIISPYFEYHKNTIVDKEQDNWQAGVSAEWQIRSIGVEWAKWSPMFIIAAKYNDDIVKKNNSFQGNLYFTPIFRGKGQDPKYFWIPNISSKFGKKIQFTYSPYVGFENENRINTSELSEKGDIYRVYFRVVASILFYPNPKNRNKGFEVNGDWQYRNNFSENVQNLTTREHIYFTSGLNYIFYSGNDGSRNAKVGIDYVNGENPTKNFEKQSFYAISLKVKL